MKEKRQESGITLWLIIGVTVLIILLMLWLTIAALFGNTDVAAIITPTNKLFLVKPC